METMSLNEKAMKVKEDSQSLCLQLRTAWEEFHSAQTQENMIGLTFDHDREKDGEND